MEGTGACLDEMRVLRIALGFFGGGQVRRLGDTLGFVREGMG